MRRDFTLFLYKEFIQNVLQWGYSFCSLESFLKGRNNKSRLIILRHDVDKRPENALIVARIENELGFRSSYYFRAVGKCFKEDIIKEIAELGHEIGYHYENLSIAAIQMKNVKCKMKNEEECQKELYDAALDDFRKNLEKFRKLYPVKTICMHGSPLSKYDNRELWNVYDYRDYGIIGEPYFDIDFNEVLYLTDTGRRWNTSGGNVRDKIQSKYNYNFKSTFDIIRALKKNELPDKIMLNVHPQRWNDKFLPWAKELVWQNIKNVVKRIFFRG